MYLGNIKKHFSWRHAILAILLTILIATVVLLAIPKRASAVPATQMNSTETAKSWVYYNALSACISGQSLSSDGISFNSPSIGGNRIKQADALSGKWFNDNVGKLDYFNPEIGYFLSIAYPSVNRDGSVVGCSGENTNWIIDAAKLWGYSDGVDLLCATGAKRYDGSDCTASATKDDFTGPDVEWRLSLSTFQNNIKKNVYGISQDPSFEPSLTGGAEHILNRNALYAGCIGSANPVEYTGADDEFTYKVKEVDPITGVISEKKYQGTKRLTDKISYFVNPQLVNSAGICKDILKKTNDTATAFQSDIKNKSAGVNEETSVQGSNSLDSTGGPTCASQVPSLGWIICPVIDGMTGLNDLMWGLISSLLKVDPLEQGSESAIYIAWGSIRNIANVAFVIIFMIMIFSQLSSAGISNYGIKKLLPKLIVGAILVNLSFIIVQVLVDLANILGSSLYDVIINITPTIGITVPSWTALVSIILSAGAAGGIAIGTIALAGGATALLWLIIPVAIMGGLGLLAAVLTLIFRQAIIPILAILAPLAFIAYLLPNTESWFKKWKELLISMLMLYPLAAIVFGGARFAASAIIGRTGGENWFNNIIGLLVLSLPLFSLPFLASKGGAILNKVNGSLKGIAEKARKPLTGYAKDRADASRADYLANGPRTRFGQKVNNSKFGGLVGSSRRIARNFEGARMTRASDKEVDEKEFKSQWESSTSKDMGLGKEYNPVNQYANRKRGGGNAAVMRSLERNTDTESDKHDLGSQFAASQPGMRAQDRLGYATKQTAIDKNTTSNRIDSSTAGKRLDENVLMGDMRNSNNKEHTVSRVGESQVGKDLKHELGTAKIVNQGHDYAAATELLKDDSILNVRMNTAAEKLVSEGASAAEAQLITEATTNVQAKPGSRLEQVTNLNGGDIREALQEAQTIKHVATTASNSADRIEKQEWETTLIDNNPVNVFGVAGPVLAATAAAGIDDINRRGETRTRAVASESIRKDNELDVAARAIMIGRNVPPNDLIRVAGEALNAAQGDNDDIGVQAAIKHLFETGSPGKKRLGQELINIPANDATESTNAAKATVLAKNVKLSDVSISTWATDSGLRDLKTIRREAKTYEGLSTEELSTQTGDTLKRGILAGGITKKAVDELLSNKQVLKNLNDENREMLENYGKDPVAERARLAALPYPD